MYIYIGNINIINMLLVCTFPRNVYVLLHFIIGCII